MFLKRFLWLFSLFFFRPLISLKVLRFCETALAGSFGCEADPSWVPCSQGIGASCPGIPWSLCT